MISSGRCHGPGCQQAANGDFCGEVCAQAWERHYAGNVDTEAHNPPPAMTRPAGGFADGGYIAGPPRRPGDDRVPALLSEGGCIQFWRGDHSGNHPLDEHPGDKPAAGGGATYPLVAPVEPQVARHWFGRVLDRLRRTR